jgi:hypothetical protein
MDRGSGSWPGQRRRTWPLAAAAVIALVAGLAAGVLLGRRSNDAFGSPAGPSRGSGPCPAPQSPDGAVRAAVCYDVLLYRLEGQSQPVTRERLLAAVTNPAAVDRLVALVGRGAPSGGRAAAGVLTVRLDSYRAQSAQVFAWTSVARSARPGVADSDVAVDATWSTDAVVVEWTGGRWGLSDADRSDTAPPEGNPNLARAWMDAPYADR